MVGFVGKRKELEQVVDGLSDFSLSGPATKCRRLDPGLPPIMEEELAGPSMAFQHEMLGEEINNVVRMSNVEDMIEGATPHVSTEDMALILYKPVDDPLLLGPGISSSSFIVSSDLIRGLKKHAFNQGNFHELEDKSPERSNRLALVPWAPPQISIRSDWVASEPETTQQFEVPMEADEAEVTSMDVEEAPEENAMGFSSENLHQLQKHCMTSPSLLNPSTHVMWSSILVPGCSELPFPLWVHEQSGSFSSKSVYRAFFQGSTSFEPWKQLWKSWAPGKCKMFLLLAIRKKCWTSDGLAKRGLQHPDRCVLCDQEKEDVQHILTTCVFSRHFWYNILAPLNLQGIAPSANEKSFADWWRKAARRAGKAKRKGVNSLIILGSWTLWKHRNSCVLDGASPCLLETQHMVKNEIHLWSLAGAKKTP